MIKLFPTSQTFRVTILVLAVSALFLTLWIHQVNARTTPPTDGPRAVGAQASPKSPNLFFVYVAADGQVMAKHSSPNPPSVGVWEARGYTRVKVTGESFAALTRNHFLQFDGLDVIGSDVRENLVQPEIKVIDFSRSAIEARVDDGSFTNEDVGEYLKILGGF